MNSQHYAHDKQPQRMLASGMTRDLNTNLDKNQGFTSLVPVSSKYYESTTVPSL